MSSLKEFISSSVYVTIDPGTSSLVASPFCLVELWLAIFWVVFTGFPCFLVTKRFFMPFCTSRKNLRRTLKNAFVCFNSSKGDNGFENILK